MKQGRNLSFYIEIVLMLLISVLVISVCAAAFSKSDTYSRSAKRLSDAVTLAASGAEVFLASQTQEEMFEILNEADNASFGAGSDAQEAGSTAATEANEVIAVTEANEAVAMTAANMVIARYNDDLEPAADGNMEMVIAWDESDGFAHGTVTVYYGSEKIYDLETGAAKSPQGAEDQTLQGAEK